MNAARIVLGVALLAACGGGEAATTEEATTAEALPADTTGATSESTLEGRLAAAGLRAVVQSVPASVRRANLYLVTAAGPVVVYVFGFETVDDARSYARTVAGQVRAAKGNLVARRVDATLYVATSSDRRAIGRQLRRVIRAGEGAGARPVRVGPR